MVKPRRPCRKGRGTSEEEMRSGGKYNSTCPNPMNRNDRKAWRLSYGLNIYPGETWAEMTDAMERHAAMVRAQVAPHRPFAVGLRLSAAAAAEADERRVAALRGRMESLGLYAHTINAFPYGRFHGPRVKERVYTPDWRMPERLAYTRRAAEILAGLLPEGASGSISTGPVSYREWMRTAEDAALAAARLREAGEMLARLRDRTGRHIGLALEPEPDCFLETEEEAIAFLSSFRQAGEGGRHLGVCFDVCHMAVLGRPVAEALRRLREAGTPVFKVQISAAPVARNEANGRHALAKFADDVYLHQTFAFDGEGGRRGRWKDLPEALEALARWPEEGEVRAHVHVPIHWRGDGAALATTADEMNEAFWREALAATQDFEIETYTFDVLPPAFRASGLVDSIVAEYRWAWERLRAVSGDAS